MKLTFVVAALACALSLPSVSRAQDLKPSADESGFKPLFDGKTLAGWDGDPTFWRAEDGLIIGETTVEKPIKNGNTFLVAQQDGKDAVFGDFELRVSYKFWADRPFGNSGIQYRSVHLPPNGPNKWIIGGYQADCDLKNTYTGICYEERCKRGIMVPRGARLKYGPGADNVKKAEVLGETEPKDVVNTAPKPAGEWNDYIIICKGNHCVQILNGHVTADFIDDNPDLARTSGVIALQLHQGKEMRVDFKNLRIKLLGGDAK